MDEVSSLANAFAVERAVVAELCRMERPHSDAPDQKKGRAALANLKREALTGAVLVDPTQAAAAARRERAEAERKTRERRQDRLAAVRSEWEYLYLGSPILARPFPYWSCRTFFRSLLVSQSHS